MSIHDIEYVTIKGEDYVEPLKTLLKDYHKEITQKPLYDKNWEKLKVLTAAGGESTNQAIELSNALDSRYLASIYAWIKENEYIEKVSFAYTLRMDWEAQAGQNFYFSHLWEEIEMTELSRRPFVCWLYKGEVVEDNIVYKVVMKHYGIKEGVTKISDIKAEKPFFTITMEGDILGVSMGADNCVVSNEACPNVDLDLHQVELHLMSVDKIDLSNALNYTDTYPDEEKGEYIQRHLLYISIDLDGVYHFKNSDLNKKSFIETTGDLFFISPNGRAIPLDQSAGMKILVKFPNAMVATLR